MAVIYAFGDSITYGAWDMEGNGWASRVRHYLDDRQDKDPSFYQIFYNLGIPGETTEGLVKRFKSEVEAREREDENAIFILAFGANDAAQINGKFAVEKEKYVENLSQIISSFKNLSKNIVILNITPVIEEMTAKPNHRNKIRLNFYIDEYNAELKKLVEREKTIFIDTNSIYKNNDYLTLFDEDGLHPNSKGHELIFQAVKAELDKILG